MYGDDIGCFMLTKSRKEKTSTGNLIRHSLEERDPSGVAVLESLNYDKSKTSFIMYTVAF